MKNCGGAFSAHLKRPRSLSLFSNFLLHYHFVLSFFIHCNPAIPTITATLHYPSPPAPPQFKIHRQRRSPQLFIFHFSSFIIHYLRRQPRHSHHHCCSALALAPHYQKSKFAPSAQPQFFILHYSFFIIHSHSSPPTPPSPPLFTIPRPALSKIEIRAAGKARML